MPDRWINWELISNPANWATVFIMLGLLALLGTVIHASWGFGRAEM